MISQSSGGNIWLGSQHPTDCESCRGVLFDGEEDIGGYRFCVSQGEDSGSSSRVITDQDNFAPLSRFT